MHGHAHHLSAQCKHSTTTLTHHGQPSQWIPQQLNPKQQACRCATSSCAHAGAACTSPHSPTGSSPCQTIREVLRGSAQAGCASKHATAACSQHCCQPSPSLPAVTTAAAAAAAATVVTAVSLATDACSNHCLRGQPPQLAAVTAASCSCYCCHPKAHPHAALLRTASGGRVTCCRHQRRRQIHRGLGAWGCGCPTRPTGLQYPPQSPSHPPGDHPYHRCPHPCRC